jgi:adenylate kinase family enzyme
MAERPRIHLTGASGAGVSTTGEATARRLGAAHLDTDSFYWLPTDPPFRTKREIPDRIAMIRNAFASASGKGWVLSGHIGAWGDDALAPQFDLVVYVDTPHEVRMARLERREAQRFGTAIEPGGRRRRDHLAFLAWAAGYDAGGRDGRTRAFHDQWLAGLNCPVLRVDGLRPSSELAAEIERAWRASRPPGREI